MRVYVESILPCDADLAWAEVRKSALLTEVAYPIFAIAPMAGGAIPELWPASATLRCKTWLFGVIPLGMHTIFFERIDAERREIQSREHDAMVQRWDHLVRIEPLGPGRCRYSDEVEIEAGPLTLAVWLFAYAFYHHRQRRWQKVARRLQTQVDAMLACAEQVREGETISLDTLMLRARASAS